MSPGMAQEVREACHVSSTAAGTVETRKWSFSTGARVR